MVVVSRKVGSPNADTLNMAFWEGAQNVEIVTEYEAMTPAQYQSKSRKSVC